MSAALAKLLETQVGAERAQWLLGGLDVDPALLAAPGPQVPRAVLAQALGVLLFDDLLHRVPSAAAYVEETVARGKRVHLDHGAVRTVSGVDRGALPPGQESVARVLRPLGYRHRETYDLSRLQMTGRSWCHLDLPTAIPQYFVSELHGERFSGEFQAAATRVFSTSSDPLGPDAGAQLATVAATGSLDMASAGDLLAVLVSCFGRQHRDPSWEDYQILLAESPEAAWIATEGTAFNHATDRVADVEAVASAERAAGRPIKETVEVSASGRVRQTAHRAAMVTRSFRPDSPDAGSTSHVVPGSFFEFITRDPLPDGSGPDLAFDAANAQQIFGMTRRA
jgi:hypothetical protein